MEQWISLTEQQQELARRLVHERQGHLFEKWDPPGIRDAEKSRFMDTLLHVDRSYPGGIVAYIHRARELLAAARDGENPYDGFVPHQPDTVDLLRFDDRYDHYEASGVSSFDRTAVVLVAGGLGERLGYSGIKLDIPVEVTEGTTYLAHYAACLRAMQERMEKPRPVPFIIMTSDETHDGTVRSLERNHYYGLERGQVHLVRQQLVPALVDNDARLATTGPYELLLKPHGHGDVHMLLHQSGLARQLHEQGVEHLVFIQDTNAQVFNAIPAALGVSAEQGFDFNSIAVRRYPGEAAGGLARLVGREREMTINVEYNQLDPLLRATVQPEGDVPDENGYSLFPGNINALIIRLASYVGILEKTGGVIAEFVNPKYADASRTTFAKPARLETMMQDLPRTFDSGERIGVTVFDRRWCFSANKNNLGDATARQAAGGPPESAASAEADFYLAGRMKLAAAGMEVREAPERTIQGITFVPGPRVVLRPSFAMTVAEVRSKIRGGSISGEATLVLDGKNVCLEQVSIQEGAALVVRAGTEPVMIADRTIRNDGFQMVPLGVGEMMDEAVPEVLRLRGYRIERLGGETVAEV